jgi:hypothetical protein
MNYHKIIETARLVLVEDDDSPNYAALLDEALASLSREEIRLVVMAQKLLEKGSFFISSDNPGTVAACRALAAEMGATVREGKPPAYIPGDIWQGNTSLIFEMPAG